MDCIIKNEFLTAVISDKGAELQSFADNISGTEYIWQGDPAVWSGRAPVLFPITGALYGDAYTYGGKRYTLHKHGFALKSVFSLDARGDSVAVFSIKHSPEHLAGTYPFKYRFEAIFRLDGRSLITDYVVHNETDGEMFYSVGAHEGFRCPRYEGESFEDYYLEFDAAGDFDTHLTVGTGLFTGATKRIAQNTGVIPLKHSYFDNDALVFKGVKSNKVSLRSRKNGESVDVEFPDTDVILFWQRPGAPYICIEPWWGSPDDAAGGGDISQKKHIVRLEKAGCKCITHKITINK